MTAAGMIDQMINNLKINFKQKWWQFQWMHNPLAGGLLTQTWPFDLTTGTEI